MINYSASALDLGLGGEGDALRQQVTDEDEERKKKLLRGAADQEQAGANVMGLAAMNLLGAFRG